MNTEEQNIGELMKRIYLTRKTLDKVWKVDYIYDMKINHRKKQVFNKQQK